MIDDIVQEVRDKGYSIRYSNDCHYSCLVIQIYNDWIKVERTIEHVFLADELSVIGLIREMLAELEKTKFKIIEIDPDFVEHVDANDGYCPCAFERTDDTLCPCKDFREQDEPGECLCGRYMKVINDVETP